MKPKYFLTSLFILATMVVLGQSLVGVNVDDLSNAQITQILKRGASQGLSEAEAEAMALSLGLSPTEAAKFKQRVAELQLDEEDVKGMEPPLGGTISRRSHCEFRK